MWTMIIGLARPFLKYIILVAVALSVALSGYFFIRKQGEQRAYEKVFEQTEVIVKKREKTDEKITRLDDPALRAKLLEWVCQSSCDTN